MTSSQSPDLKREEYGIQTINDPQHCTGWRDISEAPRDGTRVLVILKDPIPVAGRADLRNWDGRPFVARHMGGHSEWCFAAPVGHGGFPDEWMAGWMPLPAPPSSEEPRGIPSEASSACQTRDDPSDADYLAAHQRLVGLARERIASLRAQLALAVGVLRPFAEVGAEKYPGEKHTSPVYGLERQSGTGELRLYSPFSESRRELSMFTADFIAAAAFLAALSPQEGEDNAAE